jgi:hypothetical protein
MTSFLIDASNPIATVASLTQALLFQANGMARHVNANLVADAMISAYVAFYVGHGGTADEIAPILKAASDEMARMIAYRDSDVGRLDAAIGEPVGRA